MIQTTSGISSRPPGTGTCTWGGGVIDNRKFITVDPYSYSCTGVGRKNRKTYGGKTGKRGMIDVAAGEKRSGHETS